MDNPYLSLVSQVKGWLQQNVRQYYVVFQAIPKNKAGLQRVNVTTEVSTTEIAAPDNAWVPVGKWVVVPKNRKTAPLSGDFRSRPTRLIKFVEERLNSSTERNKP